MTPSSPSTRSSSSTSTPPVPKKPAPRIFESISGLYWIEDIRLALRQMDCSHTQADQGSCLDCGLELAGDGLSSSSRVSLWNSVKKVRSHPSMLRGRTRERGTPPPVKGTVRADRRHPVGSTSS